MSSANVLSIQAIEGLKAALARFGGEAQEALNAAAQEIHRTLDWLQERLNHWRNEVQRRQEDVRRAEAALARCQASGYYDPRTGRRYVPDCSAYQNALLQAQVRLREAESELHNVQHWMQLVQQAVADYQREAQRLAALLSNDLPKSTALLGQKVTTLQSYVMMGVPSSASMAREAEPVGREIETRVEGGRRGKTVGRRGAEFEAWAAENVFRGKRRITVPVELNQHLARVDEEGLGLLKRRSSDNYVDTDGSLWDTKAYDEDSIIDRDQLRDYRLMERAGYVIDAKGERVPVTSVNYLFNSHTAALSNLDYLRGEATVWYVGWHMDGTGEVRLMENQ